MALEDLFASSSIYKTLYICEDEDTCRRALHDLTQDDHSVAYISEDTVHDDHARLANKVTQFARGSVRVLLMSYAVWHSIIDVIEDHAMDHNLLVLHNMETQLKNVIMIWLMDARNRGFVPRQLDYHILFHHDEETFSLSDS